MSEFGEDVKRLVHKHLDVPKFMEGMLDEPINDALDKLVKDTSNPYDDIVKGALYPLLKSEINNQIKTQWDRLLAPAPPAAPEEGDPV